MINTQSSILYECLVYQLTTAVCCMILMSTSNRDVAINTDTDDGSESHRTISSVHNDCSLQHTTVNKSINKEHEHQS